MVPLYWSSVQILFHLIWLTFGSAGGRRSLKKQNTTRLFNSSDVAVNVVKDEILANVEIALLCVLCRRRELMSRMRVFFFHQPDLRNIDHAGYYCCTSRYNSCLFTCAYAELFIPTCPQSPTGQGKLQLSPEIQRRGRDVKGQSEDAEDDGNGRAGLSAGPPSSPSSSRSPGINTHQKNVSGFLFFVVCFFVLSFDPL